MPLPQTWNQSTTVEYILTKYVDAGRRFPPLMWVAYDAHQVRTTNACEAFDGKLNGMFHHAHPHTFLLKVQDMS